MRIIYIANTRLPTEMAHGLQIMKMCEAFSKLKVKSQKLKVELVVPWRFSISSLGKKDPFEYYKVDKIFKIKKLLCFDLTPLNRFLGPISFLTQALSFSFFAFIYLLFRQVDVIYGRDRFDLFLISFFRPVIFEIHKIHKNLDISVAKRAKKIVAISRGIKVELIEKGINEEEILTAPDGVDIDFFDIKENKEECRKLLNLPLDKKIVLYTGHLYKWKGIETLALASKSLNKDIIIVIVGGIKWYLSTFKKFVKKNKLKNILILGYQDYSKIPYYLEAADCLVLTGTKKSEISKYQTSPLKMFEYMASNRPIVASDLPSFREVLDPSTSSGQVKQNAILVKPDDPETLADGIRKVLDNPELAKKISKQAYKDVQKYTWDNRVKKILRFVL